MRELQPDGESARKAAFTRAGLPTTISKLHGSLVTGRHIAIVCPGCGKAGSVAAVALRQARGLACTFRVTLISDSHPAEPIPRVEHFHIKPPSFDWLRRYGHVPREIAFASYARRALTHLNQSRGVDFVLCHGHPVATLAAVPLQRTSKVPYGLVTHGDIFDRPAGTYDARLTQFYRSVTPKAYRSADLVVVSSTHMQALAERGGAANDSIRIIPHGIDPGELGLGSSYTPPSATGPGLPLRILFVGRFSVEKGVDTLLQACKRLIERNVQFQLRLVGDGPLRDHLRAMSTSLGVEQYSTFVGPLARDLLGSEYIDCHAVCIPSRSETFGMVAIEAMAAGRPVIGTNIGGIPFAVTHEKSGLLVPKDAPGELADALERASRNPHMLKIMGRQGYDLCRKRFTWEGVTQELVEAIDATCTGLSRVSTRTTPRTRRQN